MLSCVWLNVEHFLVLNCRLWERGKWERRNNLLFYWNLTSSKAVSEPIVIPHYCLKMSELTKTTSTFRLQLKSPAIFVSILLRLFACALGFSTAMLIDALLFEGLPGFFDLVLLALCIFGLDYRVNQLLITDCEVTATHQGLWISTAKPVLLFPRANFLLSLEEITYFRSGEIKEGRHSKRTQACLIIGRKKASSLRFRGGITFALANYLLRVFPGKERPFWGDWV